MTNEEKEYVRTEIEKCLKETRLQIEIVRTRNEKQYSKEIRIFVEEEFIDLLKIIKQRERLLMDGSCYIIFNNKKFDFTSNEVQQIWSKVMCGLTEKNYVDRICKDLE